MTNLSDDWYEKDLYNLVGKILRKRYPARLGWEIFPQYNRGTYIPDFVCMRRYRGRIEKVICEVKGGSYFKITQNDIDQINQYAIRLAGNNVKIVNKILAIPYGMDESFIPRDIEIIRLKKIGYE